ncbi:MAG: hypothetical protein GXP24_00525, partial [Planctomycetes bacterium]|nr:hypothetical protein [Planctomycetota bacterium]
MHSIRLRHPWQCERTDDTHVWSRKFNWPAELMPGETVQLVVEPMPLAATPTLNGTTLTTDANGGSDITSLLVKHNLLVITSSAASSGDPGRCP